MGFIYALYTAACETTQQRNTDSLVSKGHKGVVLNRQDVSLGVTFQESGNR